MAYIDTEVDIDPDNYYYAMSREEKEAMYGLLIENGYGDSFNSLDEPSRNLIEWEFQGIMEKIISNRLLLSAEEDEMLRKIASRF